MKNCFQSLVFWLLLPSVISAIPLARIGTTTVTGLSDKGIDAFLGIPFAEPPVGSLRLRPPVLRTSYGPTLDASRYGLSCPQPGLPPASMAEDCLSLNVFRPTNATQESRLPVMVWIHGGGFFSGSSSFYLGNNLVSASVQQGTPILYVSINYRLGPLGFPVGVDATTGGILNLGMHDQITALQWVQDNIHHFGGDKSKVTLFGESAGATSISFFQLTSRLNGLARAAILQSPGSSAFHEPSQLDDRWQTFLDAIPACATSGGRTECVRQADSSTVIQAVMQMPLMAFLPGVDGPGGLIPDRPSRLGFQANIPLIVGSNKDEGTIFTWQQTATEADIRMIIPAAFAPPILSSAELTAKMDDILSLYPNIRSLGAPFDTGNQTFGLNEQYKRAAAIFGDVAIEALRRTISRDVSQKGGTVWGYQFADPSSTPSAFLMTPFGIDANQAAPGSLGVTHTNEVAFVFGPLPPGIPPQQLASAQRSSLMIQNYWIAFAASLDPNNQPRGSSFPIWRRYRQDDPTMLMIDGTASTLIVDNFRASGISFFQNNPEFSLC